MAVFKVQDEEFEVQEPRGRNGRRATNWLITQVGDISSEDETRQLFNLLDDKEFLEKHLEAFVGKDAAMHIDKNASVAEMVNGVMVIIAQVFEGFETTEVEAAVKNSGGTQEEEE